MSGVVQDFNVNVLPNIQKNRPQDIVAYQKDINDLTKLGKSIYAGLRQFSDTDIQRALTPRSYTDPSILKGKSELGELLREAGISKFFRPLNVTQALASNDTRKTIAAYKEQLKKLYSNFIKNVQHITKLPSKSVGQIITSKKPEWTAILNKLENFLGLPLSSSSPQAQPFVSEPVPPGILPPGIPKPKTGEAPEPKSGSPQSTAGIPPPQPPSGKPGELGAGQSQFPESINTDVIMKAINVIIKNIGGDKLANSYPHYYMSTPIGDWKTKKLPSVSSKIKFPVGIEPSIGETPPSVSITEVEGGKGDEEKKGFLTRFRQYYRKYTGSFTQLIGIFDHNGIRYDVLWHSFGPGERGHGHNNEILLKVYSQLKQPPEILTLFSFWDHQIDPREPEAEEFSISNLVMWAHPHLKNPFSVEDESKFKTVEEMLHRTLFSVTDRKTLEFKSKLSKNQQEATDLLEQEENWDYEEAENYIIKASKLVGGKDAKVEDLVNKAKELKQQDTIESPAEEVQTGAINGLINLGYKEPLAKELVQKAITSGNVSSTTNIEDLIKMILTKSSAGLTPIKPMIQPTIIQPPAEQPKMVEAPKINDDGSVEWMGKKYEYSQHKPNSLWQAIEKSGQKEKLIAIINALKTKKKLTEKFINPFVSENFVQ